MVMKRNAMRKNLLQSIKGSLGRYIAIMAIIALGAGIFVGLRMTKTDMVATGQKYTDGQNMFDLRLLTSYGWSKDQVEQVAQLEGVVDAEGLFYIDLIASKEEEGDSVYRFYNIPQRINRLALLSGRMPESPDECLADGFRYDDSILGTQVTVLPTNDQDSLDAMACKTFTVVGIVSSPLYMDLNRGNTSVGNGSIANYFFVPEEAFDVDYYTEIHVTIPGDYRIYSEEYNDAMDAMADQLEPLLEPMAKARLEQLRQEAEDAYADGMWEYWKGVKEYKDGKAEAEQELLDALKELTDAEAEIADNEQKLHDGEQQIADARITLKQSRAALSQSRKTLADAKATAYAQLSDANAALFENYQTVSQNMQLVDNGLLELTAGMVELESGITQLETGLSQLDSGIEQLQMLIGIMDISIDTAQRALEVAQQAEFPDEETIAALYEKLDELIAAREEYYAQLEELQAQRAEYGAQLEELYATRAQLEAQKAELEANKKQLENAMASIEAGFMELTGKQTQMENQFASAESQINAGEAQLNAYEAELDLREQEIADGWIALEDAKRELEDGWQEYNDATAEVNQELADAARELADAEKELKDARKTIDDMVENDLYVLDRNSNIGYGSLDSSSDIVAGVSKVFPAFFLLVASLVCITTMTRMVDEERTQIGTLKALGYSSNAIIRKYLVYAGSSAVAGCSLGVVLGSIVFPMVLWEAYKIMIFITPQVVMTFDWALCIGVVLSYTAVMLLVTWYCCRRSLQEVPAELIRPKPPAAGKQLLLEKLPFWKKISFLNKVTIRNIFRYHQRLAMMLVGIGGCTALLMTGFGLRDSIERIVDIQFDEVTVYDISVSFRDGQNENDQRDFRQALAPYTQDVLFCNQVSMELDANNQTREIYVMTASEEITGFIDFHSGSTQLEMPGQNEVLLSVGVAEAMGVDVGDEVTLRNTDMEVLTLTVCGLYDNHVYNYGIVTPETVEEQWGRTPDKQMAFVRILEGKDVHGASAAISGMDDVMNVSVSEDLASMVGSMMVALDLVVVVVVICAGLLGAIVLYNLTNININERIREIATIKVLGFNAIEAALYIFKENLALSGLGSVLGLLLGKLLLAFVMSEIKIDFVWFQARLLPLSYVLSIVLTMLTACLVDFIFYFRLEKINMAEALKSVE